jgi:uncharacterized DUF497 family protein
MHVRIIRMKVLNWNAEKNQELIEKRGIPFEDVSFFLQQGALLDDLEHSNSEKYTGQRIFVLEIDNYVYLVPYVENEDEIYLKTIIPSREAAKQYLGGSNE